MKSISFYLIGISMCLTLQLSAQFTITGELRPRAELRDGYTKLSTANQDAAVFVSQRTRLGLGFKKDALQTKFTFQDARIWGGDNSFSLYEAWAKYNVNKHTAIKFGRQELHYDDGRLISARPRRQDGFYYDALVFKYGKDSLYIDAGAALNNSQANITGNQFTYANTQFKSFNFLYLKKYFDNGFDVALTGIASGMQKENTDTTYFKQTVGTKLDYKIGDFFTIVEGYYQGGKNKDGRNVNAYLLSGKLGYKLSPKVKLTAGVELISGHDATNTDADYQSTLHVFDILEGARFLYYGTANHFRNMEKHTGGGGLVDYIVKVNLNPTKKFNASLIYHKYNLNNNVLDANSEVLNTNLGSEIDVITKYKIQKGMTLVMGYSIVLPSNTLETLQNIPTGTGQTGHYFWIMLNTKLNMFSSAKK